MSLDVTVGQIFAFQRLPFIQLKSLKKYTLSEIICDKYLYFYSSRQNGVLYVNRKLAYPKDKLHFFKTLQGQKISHRRQSNITSKQLIRKNIIDLNYYELLQVVYYTVYHTDTSSRLVQIKSANENKEFLKISLFWQRRGVQSK